MNKKFKFISILFAMSFIMTAAFAKPKNFEEVWAEKTEVSQQYVNSLEEVKESFGGVIKDIKVYAEGKYLVYEYVYAVELDIETAKEALKTQFDSMKSTLKEVKKAVQKDFDYKKISIKYIYKTKDEEEILVYEF